MRWLSDARPGEYVRARIDASSRLSLSVSSDLTSDRTADLEFRVAERTRMPPLERRPMIEAMERVRQLYGFDELWSEWNTGHYLLSITALARRRGGERAEAAVALSEDLLTSAVDPAPLMIDALDRLSAELQLAPPHPAHASRDLFDELQRTGVLYRENVLRWFSRRSM